MRCECQKCESAERHVRYQGLEILPCQCKREADRSVTVNWPSPTEDKWESLDLLVCNACYEAVAKGR